ncbi:STAS domain-containing protein [Kitasatospora cineracea]|uniref:Anti-sigma factor antagonist n=1 Tax=Kitasatospora cineracea TaxID=88074 RepID=A0A3N4S964_9ACTN|nr:STAS domain-containing protein [Kitasatospora cineracea]RPE37067.1 anti-sigma B factor antagonist/stage II sporulation protein AA (anti-sigma F factor antagonist) [Kitasatospora cineracea]
MQSHDHATSAQVGAFVLEDSVGIDTRSGGDGVVVCRITGDLDIESLAPVKKALTEVLRGNRLVVVDLAQVAFCDSSGLNMLLTARADALATGAVLRLAAVSPPVERLLEITGAAAAFDVRPTVQAAIAELT